MRFNIKKRFLNIINSGWEFNEDEKMEQLRFQLLNFSLLFALIGIPIGMLFNYFSGNYTLIFIEVFIEAFILFILYRLRLKRSDYDRTTTLMTLVIILFFDTLFLFSSPEEMKFTWVLVYTAIFIFFKGNRSGWAWIFMLSLSIIAIKMQTLLPIHFSWAQISYFFLIMIILTSVISFLQYTIEENYKTILSQKNVLKKFNSELNLIIDEKLKESREKDEILFQQSKMAAMGEMIGNIAHQWRQPLNTISVVSGGLKMQHDLDELDDEQFEEGLESINETVQFLSQTINDFRDYFRPDKRKEEFDLQVSIVHDIHLIEPSYKSLGIDILSTLQSCQLYSFKNELSQVILNILNNAKDALENSPQEHKYIFITSEHRGEHVIISIKDNAGGIKEEIMPHIFEPYFTTKHQSQGTGIGLFMTREIILKHLNGSIEVTNVDYSYKDQLYKGAQFDISLNL